MVIDSNVYITYITHKKTNRLISAINIHRLDVYVNDQLLEEISKNAIKASKNDVDYINSFVLPSIVASTININTVPSFNLSPDPKDNFLFDIALQTNSPIIVTQEKALLQFADSPVPIKDLKWFKETYPVPL